VLDEAADVLECELLVALEAQMRQLQGDVRAQPFGRDPIEHLDVCQHDGLGLLPVVDAFAEQRRVRVETLVVEPAQDLDRVFQRLARDEPGCAEPHSVPPDDPLHRRAVRCREDGPAQRCVYGAGGHPRSRGS
jgi:hypothetical protein